MVGPNVIYNDNVHVLIAAYRWVYTSDAVKRFVALSRASQMRMKAFAVYLFILPTPGSPRASTRGRKRGAAQDATKFNSAELSRFTQAIQPIMYRCHELSLQRIELAITSVSSLLGNQLVASGRNAVVITVKEQS